MENGKWKMENGEWKMETGLTALAGELGTISG
jgi:hypothetical protein